jgi:GDP-4-dehydro-6-deoxy-D-mannose reductase
VCRISSIIVGGRRFPALLRAHDTPVLYGSRERLTEACGWKPQIPLEQTIEDTLAWWRERLGA